VGPVTRRAHCAHQLWKRAFPNAHPRTTTPRCPRSPAPCRSRPAPGDSCHHHARGGFRDTDGRSPSWRRDAVESVALGEGPRSTRTNRRFVSSPACIGCWRCGTSVSPSIRSAASSTTSLRSSSFGACCGCVRPRSNRPSVRNKRDYAVSKHISEHSKGTTPWTSKTSSSSTHSLCASPRRSAPRRGSGTRTLALSSATSSRRCARPLDRRQRLSLGWSQPRAVSRMARGGPDQQPHRTATPDREVSHTGQTSRSHPAEASAASAANSARAILVVCCG
jgi:hypothetical protein